MIVYNVTSAQRALLRDYDSQLKSLEHPEDNLQIHLYYHDIELLEDSGRIQRDPSQSLFGRWFIPRWVSTDPKYPNIQVFKNSYRK